MRSRRSLAMMFLSGLTALAALSLSASCARERRPDEEIQRGSRPPNIVLILADDVGSEVPGCYGGNSYPTPAIDALAREGLRFRHAYSMPVCHPTRVTLLAGRYPFRFGGPQWGSFPAEAEERTLAQVLRNAGYATAISGKWQLALLGEDPDHPHRLGFDEYCLFGWHEGPRYYQPLIWENGKVRQGTEDLYGPDVYCDFLIDFMTRNRERPFFAFYSMALCHDVTDDLEKPVPFGPRGRYDNFAEMVAAMDERVGRLVLALDLLALREKTLIVFTTDNGSPKRQIITATGGGKLVRADVTSRRGSEEVRGGKGELTDAGTRVPLIGAWRGVVPEGEVSDRLIDFSDFLPTFAALAEAPLPEGVALDGRSFAGALRDGGGVKEREWVFAEHRGDWFLRSRRWKLTSDGRLYDMEADPEEENPIERDRASGEAKAARERLEAVMEELGVEFSGAS